MCYNSPGANMRSPHSLPGARMTLHIRHMVAVAAAALVGGVMLAGYGGNAAAQETVCARSSHTKIFVPRTGKVECMQISKSLQRDNQQVQKQRQRVLQQRLRQDQLTRQLRARSNKQGATVRQRQIAQQQELPVAPARRCPAPKAAGQPTTRPSKQTATTPATMTGPSASVMISKINGRHFLGRTLGRRWRPALFRRYWAFLAVRVEGHGK